MSRPRTNYFFRDADIYRVGPDIPLEVGQITSVIGQGVEAKFKILKLHPRRDGATVQIVK